MDEFSNGQSGAKFTLIVLLPMGGHGTRFSDAGYKTNKASILTTDRHTMRKLPMVICAMKDIPGIENKAAKIICVDRLLHEKDGTEGLISNFFPSTLFIHDHVLLDQAFGCFLAREYLDSDDELFIGTCDSGMEIDFDSFQEAKKNTDVIMISHTNDENIAANPLAHSWAVVEESSSRIKSLSLKQTVSDSPMKDHATTGMFWFKRARDFLKHLEEMIWARDTLNGKYYVDKVLQYCISGGLKVDYFDVKFICWGTPLDYENYEKTMKYWTDFSSKEKLF